jgi:hypothetical protein
MAHSWGGWVVIENYPSLLKWPRPASRYDGKGNYEMWRDAVTKCTNCHEIAIREVTWPEDAYFQWDIRGHTLWAWNREHAQVLLDFLGSKERDESKYGWYAKGLSKLPGELISSKVRGLVVKRIKETLNGNVSK